MTAALLDLEPTTAALIPDNRRLISSPSGLLTFTLCTTCEHWVKRHRVVKCECCTSHPERPAVVLVHDEDDDADEPTPVG